MASRLTLKLALAGGLIMGSTAWAAPSGTMLAQTCAACHGTEGASVAYIPSLAAMDPDYFVEAMQAFKSGDRKATVMDRIAKGYSDEQLERMGQYFAQQKPVPMKQLFSQSKARQGARLHEDYCEKCHEDGGMNPEDSAVLAGQSKIYLQYSMADFREGHREAPKKMAKKVRQLLEEEGDAGLDAVIHYYISQQ